MALEIIGNVLSTGTPTEIQTRDGRTFTRRTLVLVQRMFDQWTGEEKPANYPTIEFGNDDCKMLEQWKAGDRVRVSFRLRGTQYQDKQTGETRYFNTLQGYKVEAAPLPSQQPPQAAPQQAPAPQPYQPYEPQPQQAYDPAQHQQPVQNDLPW